MSTLRKAGKYKNLKKLAMSMLEGESPDYDPEDDTEFRFQDVARKKFWFMNTGVFTILKIPVLLNLL